MSNHVLFVKPGFIRNSAPMLNGLGRFIPQLQRITFKFCKIRRDSHGIRQFIEHDIVKFAEQNPHCAVYLKPRRLRTPLIVAEYLTGVRHYQYCTKLDHEAVRAWVDILSTHSGKEFQTQLKTTHTDHPSIQGMWNPYVNDEPSLATATFPSESLSQPPHLPQTATEKLLKMYKEQQQQGQGSSEA